MKTAACRMLGLALLLAASGVVRAGDEAATLSVHLPRSVEAAGEALRLGEITILRSPDDRLRTTSERIAMGRAPWSGERIVLDRATVAARLASHGLGADRVRFTGADRVVVTRAEEVTSAKAIAQAARAFLETSRPAPAGCRWYLRREPDTIAAPAGADVSLSPRPASHGVAGEAKVTVVATAGGKQVGAADVVFRMMYARRRLLASRDIAPGEVISPENTTVRKAFSPRPDPGDWSKPYGRRAARLIAAGAEVKPGLVHSPAEEVVVRRNQGVVMTISGRLFQVTALGKALEDGRPGDLIKVRNADSGRVVLAKVARDGTVEPVIAEREPYATHDY